MPILALDRREVRGTTTWNRVASPRGKVTLSRLALDRREGNERWRATPASALYEYKALQNCVSARARAAGGGDDGPRRHS